MAPRVCRQHCHCLAEHRRPSVTLCQWPPDCRANPCCHRVVVARLLAVLRERLSPGLVSADTGNSLLSDSPALTLLLLSFCLLLRAVRTQPALVFVCAGLVLALA